MLISIADFMQNKFFFSYSLEVVIPYRQEWVVEGWIRKKSVLWFTDCFKKVDWVGVGVRGLEVGLTEPLGAYLTIIQLYVHAIKLCARENLSRKLINERIYIPIHLCLLRIEEDLESQNDVTLMWVRARLGIFGNEAAD